MTGSDNEHALVWDLKWYETLIKPTRGSGEHMVDESVYQIQVGWGGKGEYPSFKVAGRKLLRE